MKKVIDITQILCYYNSVIGGWTITHILSFI